ncbi:MAG: ribonuclease HII [Pseudomonadota bacterium]
MLIAGVDEVGRGPLVGDVVAAAVILPSSHNIVGIKDSKKLTKNKREVLAARIKQDAVAWAVGRASPQEIDEINILHASMLAMKRAVSALSIKPDHVLVDGNRLPKWEFNADAVVKGDNIHEQIAAASIIAKVTRDEDMQALDLVYPDYGFANHKGYPTPQHLHALSTLGPLPMYRQSFKPVQAMKRGYPKGGK